MFKFFRKHRTVVLIFLAVIVVILPFFGIGSTTFMDSSHDTIIKVNGGKIKQSQFNQLYNQITRQRSGELSNEQRQQLTSETMNELVREQVFAQEAKKYGIHATDQALQFELASIPAFQKNNQFDMQTYYQVVTQSFAMAPHDFEKKHKRDVESRRLNQLVASAVHLTDEEIAHEQAKYLATEKDKELLKKWKEDPESFKQDVLMKERNLVFQDWLNQLNSTLKVQIVSENFRKRLSGVAQ